MLRIKKKILISRLQRTKWLCRYDLIDFHCCYLSRISRWEWARSIMRIESSVNWNTEMGFFFQSLKIKSWVSLLSCRGYGLFIPCQCLYSQQKELVLALNKQYKAMHRFSWWPELLFPLSYPTTLGDPTTLLFKVTFYPFGIIFDCAKGRSIAHASVNNSITSQEVSHRGRI